MDSRAGSSDGHPPPLLFPPPPIPPPLAFPAPPPLPAAFLAPSPAQKLSTRPEMKINWDRILPLMADCVEARKLHQDSLKDVGDFERMVQTQHFTQMNTADKQRVERQFAELKSASEAKGAKTQEALRGLRETNWWPVGPNQDEGAADRYRELIQYAVQLNTTATEMYAQYIKNAAYKPAPAPHELASRPLKRRRVGDGISILNPLDSVDFDNLRDKLAGLEERVEDIRNDFATLEARNDEDIVAQIGAKLESISFALHNPSNPSEQVQMDQMKNADDLDRLTEAVAFLLSESEKNSIQGTSLDKEQEQYPEELAALQKRFQAYEDANEKDQKSMEAITAALDALRARPPSPPSLPPGFILAAIEEPIRASVQSAVQPIIRKMEKDLEDKIVKQDAKTYGQLWGKIALTLQFVDAVCKVTPVRSPVAVS